MSNESATPMMATVDPASREDYIYNRLLKERIIWLGSEVRDENANAICSQLLLLSSGTKGKRYATPHARILMHQPSGGIGGTASDIKIQAELILHMKRVMAELTAEQTGQSVEQILKDNDRDKWFTAEEGLEYGFFDHISAHAGGVTGGGGTSQDS